MNKDKQKLDALKRLNHWLNTNGTEIKYNARGHIEIESVTVAHDQRIIDALNEIKSMRF